MRVDLSQHARRNLDRFFSSAGTTSERYGAVLRSPGAVEKALTIFEFSEFLTDILVRHPEEIALLEQVDEKAVWETHRLFAPAATDADAADDPVFEYLARGTIDGDEAMAVLRRHYRQRTVRSGALDLFHTREVFDSLRDNTAAADAAIQAALAIAASSSVAPSPEAMGTPGKPAGFAVLGLGRLGAGEFDLLSDADVLFVCNEQCSRDSTRRSAERLMEALTAYTRDGTVFSVDARLRPHGREGELVITPAQLQAYFCDEAQPWEALTYLKLRPVAGDVALAEQAVAIAQRGAAELAFREDFATQLRDLRQRLERSDTAPNLKTGPGGVYDIDYLAGVLQVKHRIWMTGNLLERLRALQAAGLLQQDEFDMLAASAHLLRTLEHVVRLVSGRARKWLPVAEHPRRATQKLLWRMLAASDSFDPEMRLMELMRQTREIYSRKMSE
jgi:glutamate-ammonia-ligase adenylyltransferase